MADDLSDIKADLRYTDLREWIDLATKLGEVREAPGLSWQEDIGMRPKSSCMKKARPASSSLTFPVRFRAVACW